MHRMKETEGYGSSMGKLKDMRDAQLEDIQKTDIMEVKKGDLSTHLNEDYVVRVHFSRDDYSATDALKHYLKQIAELKY